MEKLFELYLTKVEMLTMDERKVFTKFFERINSPTITFSTKPVFPGICDTCTHIGGHEKGKLGKCIHCKQKI